MYYDSLSEIKKMPWYTRPFLTTHTKTKLQEKIRDIAKQIQVFKASGTKKED